MNKTVSEAFALLDVFRQITNNSVAILLSCGTIRYLSKGEHLFFDKETVEMVYLVASGLVSLYKVNAHGDKKVIFILDQGKFINEVILQGLPASISCEAFADAQILCFEKTSFLRAMENDFALTKIVLDSLAIKVRRLYRQLKNTANSVRGDKRVAAKLWKLSSDYGVLVEDGTKIKLDLSITYLADMLGSRRETVSRQLKHLVRRGLIRLNDGQITIKDRDEIAKYFKQP